MVYAIRLKWIITNDDRHDKYSYNQMYKATSKNWFGIKAIKEQDFK